MMNARWTPGQIKLLQKLYPNTPTIDVAIAVGRSVAQVYRKAKAMNLKKSDAFLNSPHSGRIRPGSDIGRANHFPPGHVPVNKGIKGINYPGSVPTQFKPGHRGGIALTRYQPIGTERISEDGYLERKINNQPAPHRRWRAVHLLLWESINGPLPRGHAVAFKDGDKSNIDINNLELVTRADLMKRNTIHNYPKEIVELTRLRATVTKKINRMERKAS